MRGRAAVVLVGGLLSPLLLVGCGSKGSDGAAVSTTRGSGQEVDLSDIDDPLATTTSTTSTTTTTTEPAATTTTIPALKASWACPYPALLGPKGPQTPYGSPEEAMRGSFPEARAVIQERSDDVAVYALLDPDGAILQTQQVIHKGDLWELGGRRTCDAPGTNAPPTTTTTSTTTTTMPPTTTTTAPKVSMTPGKRP